MAHSGLGAASYRLVAGVVYIPACPPSQQLHSKTQTQAQTIFSQSSCEGVIELVSGKLFDAPLIGVYCGLTMKGMNAGIVLVLALSIFGVFYLFDHASFSQSAQSASVLMSRQIETALEFYYIEHGHYPRVESDELIEELKRSGELQARFPEVDVKYQVLQDGVRYELR